MDDDKILDTKIETEATAAQESKFKLWLKRIGLVGFLFFLIKGLVWIAIFAGLGKCALS